MKFNYDILDENEKLTFALRSLYAEYGYKLYRMSKFEEYDLYGKNKDFLVSDSVITFTDTNGRLMALKPDVTLSIIKNIRDTDCICKLCYNENVYRVSGREGSFREIMQAGLECFGPVDSGCIGEVLTLASKSLEITGRDYVLGISHLGILTKLTDMITDDDDIKKQIIKCVGSKNLHGIDEICRINGIKEELKEPITELVSLYGDPDDVIGKLEKIAEKYDITGELDELRSALGAYDGKNAVVDFSTVADVNYYNGIVFKGYVDGVPDSVISGGRYDRLMHKMGRRSGAVGFAVYLDMLDRIIETR